MAPAEPAAAPPCPARGVSRGCSASFLNGSTGVRHIGHVTSRFLCHCVSSHRRRQIEWYLCPHPSCCCVSGTTEQLGLPRGLSSAMQIAQTSGGQSGSCCCSGCTVRDFFHGKAGVRGPRRGVGSAGG